MADRNIGLEIVDGIREIKAFKDGKADLKTRVLSEPSHPKEIRARLNITISICQLDGCKFTHGPGLGARQTGATRPGQIPFTDRRTTSEFIP